MVNSKKNCAPRMQYSNCKTIIEAVVNKINKVIFTKTDFSKSFLAKDIVLKAIVSHISSPLHLPKIITGIKSFNTVSHLRQN